MVVLDTGLPLGDTLVPAYARVPRCVVTAFTFVLAVLLVRNLSQISYAVISSDSVDVVYLVFGPVAVVVQPGESVSFVESVLYADIPVAVSSRAACYVAGFYVASRAHSSSEYACIRVVMQNLAQLLCGELIRGRCGIIVFRHTLSAFSVGLEDLDRF